jgi:23S rRNA pseudouridine1911/1915/1917 synthase
LRRDASDESVLLERQALHARRLRFHHPSSGKVMEIEAPLPCDIAAVLGELREYRRLR